MTCILPKTKDFRILHDTNLKMLEEKQIKLFNFRFFLVKFLQKKITKENKLLLPSYSLFCFVNL